MDWKKLADKAEQVINERGGIQSVEQDAQELAGIAEGNGSLTDKLKAAGQALKQPGAAPQQGAAPQNQGQHGAPQNPPAQSGSS